METVPRQIFRNEIPFLSLLTSFTSTDCVELDEHSHGLYKLAQCTAITIILMAFTSTCTYKTKQNFANFFPAFKFFALLCVHFLFYCDLDDLNFLPIRFGLAKSSRSGSDPQISLILAPLCKANSIGKTYKCRRHAVKCSQHQCYISKVMLTYSLSGSLEEMVCLLVLNKSITDQRPKL
jgi:hypothetical protein